MINFYRTSRYVAINLDVAPMVLVPDETLDNGDNAVVVKVDGRHFILHRGSLESCGEFMDTLFGPYRGDDGGIEYNGIGDDEGTP